MARVRGRANDTKGPHTSTFHCTVPARKGARLQAVRAHARPPTPAGCPRARLLRTGMLGLGLHGLAALWSRAGGGEVNEVEGVDDLRGAVRLLAAGAGPMETYAGAGARLGGHYFEGV